MFVSVRLSARQQKSQLCTFWSWILVLLTHMRSGKWLEKNREKNQFLISMDRVRHVWFWYITAWTLVNECVYVSVAFQHHTCWQLTSDKIDMPFFGPVTRKNWNHTSCTPNKGWRKWTVEIEITRVIENGNEIYKENNRARKSEWVRERKGEN